MTDDKPIEEEFIAIIDQYKNYRDLFVDYIEALIYSGLPQVNSIATIFERLYNELHDYNSRKELSQYIFELADFMIWELFIDTIATLLHFERYQEIHDLIIHPYFLRRDKYNDAVDAYGYYIFRTHSHVIEEICKPKSDKPNRFTMSGEIILNREKKPILTKESISNADLVLYQLGTILPAPSSGGWRDYWFPTTYVYHQQPQLIWQKLKSREHCKKLTRLFGVKNIEEIKELIKNSTADREMRYNSSFECARGILNSIKIDDIGVLY